MPVFPLHSQGVNTELFTKECVFEWYQFCVHSIIFAAPRWPKKTNIADLMKAFTALLTMRGKKF